MAKKLPPVDDGKVVKLKAAPRPASGIPASGIPAGGFIYSPPRGNTGKTPAEMVTTKAERVAALEALFYNIAMDEAQQPCNRLNAATRLHAILEGTPIQRQVRAEVDSVAELTDLELKRELEEIRRTGTDTI